MLGHCGSPLLNHVEGFNKIQASNPNAKLLVPISYGNKRYIKHLKKVLLNRGHDTIEFLENRLQKEQYYSVLSSVSVFFLNSYCQQGLGNIVFFLLNGSTLYLSEKSTTFQFLNRKGFKVFSIESLSLDGKIILLSDDEKLINQSKIREMLEVNYVEKQWLKLISE